MRNYELIKAIYDRCPDMAKYPKEYTIDQIFDRTQDIIDMIELHRPEIAGKLPTHESKMEEMRKHPHQDNHMD
jgi:hypothetical protein